MCIDNYCSFLYYYFLKSFCIFCGCDVLTQKKRAMNINICIITKYKKPTNWLCQIRPKAVGGGIFGHFFELR